LAVDEKVDLINLSWGNPEPDRNTLGAINVANELGVTVVAAAGNDPVQKMPFFPARLPNCICVGALGLRGWGPADTYSGWYSNVSATKGRLGTIQNVGQVYQVYAWLESTCGDGLDAIAPGVGILIQKEGRISHDISGTSFAAPLVAGTMAVVLADNKDYPTLPRTIRTNWVRQLFMRMCRPSGIASEHEGTGVPRVACKLSF
jgi:subtilisin family serine protease